MSELLLNYVLVFVSVSWTFIVMCTLYPYKLKKKLVFLFILVIFIFSILLGMTIKMVVPLFSLLGAIILFCFTKKQLYQSILYATLGEFLVFAFDLIVSNIIDILFTSPEILHSNPIYSAIVVSFTGAVTCSICLFLKMIIKKIKFNAWNQIGLVDKLLTSILLIYSIVLLLSNINLLLSRGYDTKIILLLGILFLAYITLIIVILFRITKSINIRMEATHKTEQLQHQEALLQQSREYTNELERLYGNMRIFRHDYINILSTMSGYMEEKKWDELELYFNKKILPIGKDMDKNNYKLGLLKNIKIMELKGVLSTKTIYAQEKDIDFIIDVTEEITDINMNRIDLCKSVGIILDNAIEAALESEERFVKCGIVKRESSILIVVCNSYNGKTVDIRKIFEKGYSTKSDEKNNRGFGLYIVNKMINSYMNTTMEIDIMAKEFKISIEIFETDLENDLLE